MLSCKQSTELMSHALDRRLSFAETLGLRLHLLVCVGCRNARRHLLFIRQACARWAERDDD